MVTGTELPDDRTNSVPLVLESVSKLSELKKPRFELFLKGLKMPEDNALLAGLPQKRAPLDAIRGICSIDDETTRNVLFRSLLKPGVSISGPELAAQAKTGLKSLVSFLTSKESEGQKDLERDLAENVRKQDVHLKTMRRL